jgi:serine/threonine protein kinase
MELIDGEPLSRWQRGSPSVDAILDAYRQAGRGLVAAHGSGVVHRDFKPGNVMRGRDGRVRVVDFGLARHLRTHETLQHPFMRGDDRSGVAGTLPYMAPEQHVLDQPVTEAADQFSFCVAHWEALFGERPYGSTHPDTVATAHAALVVPVQRRIPRSIERALLRGLSPRPEDRWPNMARLLATLRPVQRRC